MGVAGLTLPTAGVKFYPDGDPIPDAVLAYKPSEISLTSCQALRQALLGDAVLLTLDNVGCVAAAISLGLVDENQASPLNGPRVYTEIIREHSATAPDWSPPSPKDFTDGLVYACSDAGRLDFCLFGPEDSGRFHDTPTASRAVSEMTAIQPATMRGVFFFPPDFDDKEIEPDVVVMSIRPVELARMVQAYGYNTGKRVNSSMGSVRVVNSDLIARPYLSGEINVSSYCVGARLIAQFEGDRLGMGIPFKEYGELVKGMTDSRTGYPFAQYPGAAG